MKLLGPSGRPSPLACLPCLALIAAVLLGVAWLGLVRRDESPEQRPVRLLALGDSYTVGEGVGADERWPTLLAERLEDAGIPVETTRVVARTGWTTDELAAALADAAHDEGLDDPQDLVTLAIGVNDQYRGRDVEAFRAGFRTLLERAVELAGDRPGRVIVVSIPDWGETPFAAERDRDAIAREIAAYNRAILEEVADRRVRHVDVGAISSDAAATPSGLVGDGLHYSAETHERWADAIAAVALRALQ